MLTFNIQAGNKNYYRGHKPSNHYGNCWGDRKSALPFSIDQAREWMRVSKMWTIHHIVIDVEHESPISSYAWEREKFCLDGGYFEDFEEKTKKIKDFKITILPDGKIKIKRGDKSYNKQIKNIISSLVDGEQKTMEELNCFLKGSEEVEVLLGDTIMCG